MWIEVLGEYGNSMGFKNINDGHYICTQKDKNGGTVALLKK